MSRSQTRTRLLSLASVPMLVAGGLGLAAAAPAAAATGDAEATALEVDLAADLLDTELLAISESFVVTSAPEGDGTDADEALTVPIDEDLLGLDVQALSSSSTRDGDGLSSEAAIASAQLRLDDTVVVQAEALEAATSCPEDGDPTATANVASVQLLDEFVDLDADAPGQVEVPVDLELEEVAEVDALIDVRQIEEADAETARAAALVIDVALEVDLVDEDVVNLEVGQIVLAQASCEKATGTDDGNGDDNGDHGDGVPTLPGDDDNGDNGDGVPTLPGDDDNGDDGDGLPGVPGDDDATDGGNADALVPDEGPTSGGTEVTVEGDDLDQADSVTIDGQEVDGTVSDDGTELTFTTPGGDAGEVDVVVTFDDGTTDTLAFTYVDSTEVLAEGTDAAGDATTAGTAGDGTTGDATGTAAAAGEGSGDLPRTGNEAVIGLALGLLLLAAGSVLMVWHRDEALTV